MTLGSVTTEAIAVANGQPYGELPVPVREGWTFVGWFTEQGDDKGNLVTSATVAELLTNQTLYAHWSEIKTLVSLSDLAYSFPNSREGFGYDADYRIDYGQYAIIFGDTPAAKSNYEADETWGGNCYGISVTAGMFCQAGNEISVGDFKIGASVPSELKLDNTNSRSGWNNMSLQAFIETMQVSQKNSSVQNSIHKNKNRYEDMCSAVRVFQTTKFNPVVIAIARNKSGHAMLGYALVDISNNESHLMVYDSNFPDTERYITLYKSAGKITGWYYHMNQQLDWGSNYDGSWISYVPYSDFCVPWFTKGSGNTDGGRELLSVNTNSAEILDVFGQTVASVTLGDLQTSRDDIFPMLELAEEKGSEKKGLSVWLPLGEYTIVNKDPSLDSFQVTMVHQNQSTTVSTTASKVTFS